MPTKNVRTLSITPNVPVHTQIICFVTGHKKTIRDVARIDEAETVKLTTSRGVEYIIYKEKVLWVERYAEQDVLRPGPVDDLNGFI